MPQSMSYRYSARKERGNNQEKNQQPPARSHTTIADKNGAESAAAGTARGGRRSRI
jgi:hypothetical protein